jgi:hypothetical protein
MMGVIALVIATTLCMTEFGALQYWDFTWGGGRDPMRYTFRHATFLLSLVLRSILAVVSPAPPPFQ